MGEGRDSDDELANSCMVQLRDWSMQVKVCAHHLHVLLLSVVDVVVVALDRHAKQVKREEHDVVVELLLLANALTLNRCCCC